MSFAARSGLRRLLLTMAFAVAGTAAMATVPGLASAQAKPATGHGRADETVALASLPAEAQATRTLIAQGGPFPYPKDGAVFGNRERRLSARSRGYYREYTVPTPTSRDRGARRIVCGGTVPTAPDSCFYTDDHYASFRLIAQ